MTSCWMEGIMTLLDCCEPMKHLIKCSPVNSITSHQEAVVDGMVSNSKSVMTSRHDSSRCCYTFENSGHRGRCDDPDDKKISIPYKFHAVISDYNVTESILHWIPLVFIIWLIFKAIYDDKSALDDDKSKHTGRQTS